MEFTFDTEKVEAAGYTLESIYNAMKENFKKRNLKCVSDGEFLSFSGTGHSDDYGNMLVLVKRLSSEDWFMNTAKSWFFEYGNTYEDVLKDIKNKISKGRVNMASKSESNAMV